MKSNARILIVDDNEDLLAGLKIFLAPYVTEVTTLKNPNQMLGLLQKSSYDLILLDMNFTAGINSGNEGLYWMRRVLEFDPLASILLITAYGDIELALKAIKEGATDFISKSWDEEKVLSSIMNALKDRESKLKIKLLQSKQKHLSDKTINTNVCIGKSEAMQEIMATINKVAKTDANILILGENGSGKEVIAREIHRLSNRSEEILVTVDLASLSESLFESELFGYKKGAFTDAGEDKTGFMEVADGGTLFLDEIGNLSFSAQSKLLSVLQNRAITPVGSVKKVPVDFRLISATNKPLYSMVEEKTFREDLLYRINTIVIELPPLRGRREDIALLVNFFVKKYADKYGKKCFSVSQNALDKLKAYNWPGNIRELQHAVEKAVILNDSGELGEQDFDFSSRKPVKNIESFNLPENEKLIIALAIEKFKGNMSNAAKALGINRSTLYEKIKRYDL